MHSGRIHTLLLGCALVAAAGWTYPSTPPSPGALDVCNCPGCPGAGKELIPAAGFWPTPRMLELFIDRETEKMGRRYELDEEQLYQTRRMFKERLPRWMNQNRAEIQSATNFFFETIMGEKAPTVESVAKWSQGVLPLLDEFQDVLGEITDGMQDYMTADQIVMLEGDRAGLFAGLSVFGEKFERWAKGGFDPAEFVPPNDPQAQEISDVERQLLEVEMEEARTLARAQAAKRLGITTVESGAGKKPPPVAVEAGTTRVEPRQPTDDWVAYVEEFKRRYALNPDQSANADRFLAGKVEYRNSYLRRNERRMKQITGWFKDPDQYDRAKRAYAKLTLPIERAFQALKDQLESLPTRKQRAAAGRGAEARAGGDPK